MNEYQQTSFSDESGSRRDTLISKVLTLDGREQRMLNWIPPEALIDLRKNGALSELREAKRQAVDALHMNCTASESPQFPPQ